MSKGGEEDTEIADQEQSRTRWAEDRTILAHERTFSAWMGTGLGAVGVAIGLKPVFGEIEPTWIAKAVASLFIATAILICRMAQRQAARMLDRLRENDAEALPAHGVVRRASAMTIATQAAGGVLRAL